MKRVALVAAHFVPSNLASVHRSRLWALHLREFGWEPIIVTTHWNHYEEAIEEDLLKLVANDIRVIRTTALPVLPGRFVGDLGLRAAPWHLASLWRLCRAGEVDFVHITVPSFYSACLGRFGPFLCGVPYGIDYIDPWVHDFPGSGNRFSRAWFSSLLARVLEPFAVKRAALISGIHRLYYEGVVSRNPSLAQSAVLADMPYGGSEADHVYVRNNPRDPYLFTKHRRKFNLIYAGAMLPKAYPVLESLLGGISLLNKADPTFSDRFHLHFVGTGKSADDIGGHNILPYIEKYQLKTCVSEYPARIPYLDVLAHLENASGILILGSTEKHYSPSKVYQSLLAKRPVIAVLHQQGPALSVINGALHRVTIRIHDEHLPSAGEMASAVSAFLSGRYDGPERPLTTCHEGRSARDSARRLAEALDCALERCRR